MVCLALGWNPQNSYILLLLIQVACCGLFCIRLKSPEQLHFVALFKWRVVVCLALGWNPQNSYILLLIQVACWHPMNSGLWLALGWNPQNSYILLLLIQLQGWNGILLLCVVVCFAFGWNPQNSYILLLLIQVACCGLFCIRLKSPEQLHLVAYYSSGMLWFVLH